MNLATNLQQILYKQKVGAKHLLRLKTQTNFYKCLYTVYGDWQHSLFLQDKITHRLVNVSNQQATQVSHIPGSILPLTSPNIAIRFLITGFYSYKSGLHTADLTKREIQCQTASHYQSLHLSRV